METYVIVSSTKAESIYYYELALNRLYPIVIRSFKYGKPIIITRDGIRLEFVSSGDWFDRNLRLGRHDVVEMWDHRFESLLDVWESEYW